MKGFISLHRTIFEDDFWFSEPFTRAQAWIDLLLLANHKEKKVLIKGKVYNCKRGQLIRSTKNLAERWKWSRDKASKFLQLLEDLDQIRHQKDNITTCISILNYDKYQNTDIKTTSKRHQNDTNNNVNNDNKYSQPTFQEFLEYAKTRHDYSHLKEKSLRNKYDSWDVNDWKDGNGKQIKNWKQKLIQTIPYLKEDSKIHNGTADSLWM